VFPTLGDLAGVKGPAGSEGKNPAPLLAGKQTKGHDSIFTAYPKNQPAVRDERWKMIVYPRGKKGQLFHLQRDPAERKDLAADKSHAAEIERLMALLKESQKEAGDKQPLRTDKPEPLEFDFSKVPPVKK